DEWQIDRCGVLSLVMVRNARSQSGGTQRRAFDILMEGSRRSLLLNALAQTMPDGVRTQVRRQQAALIGADRRWARRSGALTGTKGQSGPLLANHVCPLLLFHRSAPLHRSRALARRRKRFPVAIGGP